MCKLKGSDPIKPSDCIAPLSAPLASREKPINDSADVQNSKDSLTIEQFTSDDCKLSVHHENIGPTKP